MAVWRNPGNLSANKHKQADAAIVSGRMWDRAVQGLLPDVNASMVQEHVKY